MNSRTYSAPSFPVDETEMEQLLFPQTRHPESDILRFRRMAVLGKLPENRQIATKASP
jgi:hypothetical protein